MALKDHLAVVSSQVVQEFFNVATRKFTQPMNTRDCQDYLTTVFVPICEVFTTVSLYQQALSIREETHYSFYDTLILAAALQVNCRILYSEDLAHGHQVRQLRILDHFCITQETP